MDASGNNSPEFAVTTQGTGPGELVWLASGQQIGVSGLSVSISGLSISAGPTTTTQASTGITGNFVWLAGSQTISVQISGIAPTTTAAGASGVTGLPVWVGNPGSGGGASATATSQSAMSTGVGVWLAPTQTVTAAISGVVPTTTAAGLSGVTGIPVWIGGGSVGGATATATSQSAMSTALGVWFAPTQTMALLSTVATIGTVLGTLLVSAGAAISISGIVATTTAAGLSGVGGLPVWVANPGSGGGASATATSQSAMSTALGVWLAPTQTMAVISTIVTILGTIPVQLASVVAVSTVVTVLGTVLVSAAGPISISGVVPTTTASGLSGITGLPVWVQGISGAGASATATSQSAMSTALGVWLAPTQTLGLVSTVLTVLGTVLVSEAAPISISGIAATTTASGLSGVGGLPVWVANIQAGSGAPATATSQSAMSTAVGVWLAQTQTLSLVSTIVTVLGTQIVSVVPGVSVSAVVSGTVSLVTVSTVATVVTLLGTVAVSQVAAISISGIVPTTTAAGLSGVTGLPVWQVGGGSGASATATSQSAMSTALGVWLAPTQTMSLVSTLLTVLGTVLVSAAGPISISGVVPTTTASGLSGITGLPVWVQGISGAGATASATSQSAMSTALGVWLAQTQTLSLVSTIVTVLGTQIVSVVPGLSVSAVVSGTVALVTVSTVATVVTLLGTVAVSQVAAISISGVVPTTTASGLSGVTGLPVWMVGGAGGGTTLISVVSTIVTILGFSVVTTSSQAATASGLAVWVGNSGGASGATATSQSAMSTALGVWLAPTQTITVAISAIAATTTASGLSGISGLPVWVGNTVSVSVSVSVSLSGSLQISGIVPTTTASGLSGVTGLPVWFVGGAGGTTLISVVSTIVTILGFSVVTTSSQAATASGLAVWVGNPGGASGATATSQSAMSTALGVWLAPTQTLALLSTVVTVLGTVAVSQVAAISISGIVPTTTASGLSGVTGLPVWMVGGGGSGATATATSQSAMSTALGVWLAQTQTLSLVSTIVTVLGTQVVTVVPGLSVSAVVSGTVNVIISGVVPTTTASGLSGVTGLPVWMVGGGSGATATATSQSAMSTALGVWLAQTQTLSLVSTIVTILGTQIVSVVPGLSVTAVTLLGTVAVSQVAAVSLSGAGATVTQSSLTTGVPVIFVQTQTIGAVNTIVTVLGTQVVTVVPGLSVSAAVAGTVSLVTVSTVGTIVTVLGTQVVTVVPGLSVSAVVSGTVALVTVAFTTTASGLSGITGLPVWIGNTVSVSVSVSVSLSGSLQISGILPTTTASGLSGVTGLPVWMVGGAGGAAATATSQSAMSTALGVWLAPTQTVALISTILTVLGTVLVSQVPGANVVISGILPTTTASGGSGLTALPVWQLNNGITIQQSAQVQVNIAGTILLAAAASSSAGPIPFTINVGTTAATVGSAWTIPATNFRLYAVNLFVTGAGATTPTAGYFQVAYSSAGTTGTATSPTILSTKPQLVKIPIGFGPAALSVGIVGGQLDIGGGLTQTIMLWFNYPGTTNTSATIMFNLLAYLF